MNYFRMYPGDYLRDTSHLTPLQHGCFLLLLMAYYSRGGPLPSEPTALYRIASAMSKEEQAAVDFVAKAFFKPRSGVLHNSKADELIAHDLERVESAKRSANARWNGCERIANEHANAMLSSTSSSTSSNSGANTNSNSDGESAEFSEFWKAFPISKGKRSDAWKQWDQLGCQQIAETVIAAVRNHARLADWSKDGGKWIPSAKLFLKDRRWENKIQLASEVYTSKVLKPGEILK